MKKKKCKIEGKKRGEEIRVGKCNENAAVKMQINFKKLNPCAKVRTIDVLEFFAPYDRCFKIYFDPYDRCFNIYFDPYDRCLNFF